MAPQPREESWRGDQDHATAVVVVGGRRHAIGELARKLTDGVLFVAAPGLQRGASHSRTTAMLSASRHDGSRGIGAEIAVMACRERVVDGFQRAGQGTRFAQFEYFGLP